MRQFPAMLDFFYTILIAPLEYWMHAVLCWGYDRLHVWGWAIVVMSLVVNFVILPIYIKAESWQEEERAIRKRFEAKEAMIKTVFKGQERFAMISTMQRQAGYTPLLTLRSSIGFFLQIPFFFAAYHFLSNFAPLSGVSFLGLTDLSKPDAMISLGNWSINVMPILMTVLNLFSALVYTHNLSRRDKIQLYGMAAVFLVLLYDAASGLVLYWTCNNIFSLGKNIVYDLFDRMNFASLMARVNFWRQQTIGRPDSKEGHPTAYPWLLVGVWLFATILAFASSNQISILPETTKLHFSTVSDIGYLLLAALSIIEIVRLRLWRDHKVMLLVVAVILWYGLKVWYKWFFAGDNRHQFSLIGGLLFLIPTLALTSVRVNFSKFLYPKKSPATLFTSASIWLVILIAGYLPIQAYCTAPEIFSPAADILAKSLCWIVVGGVLFWLIGQLFSIQGRLNVAGYLFGFLAVLFTVYAFLLPMNVGTIDAFQIADTAPLYQFRNLAVDFAVFSVVGALFVFLVRSGRSKLLQNFFVLCIVAAIGNGTFSLWQSQNKWRDMSHTESVDLPDFNDRLFGFSKTKPNTVVVMLDAFTGTHMRQIVEEFPDIKDAYRGFTWYSDTLATGGNTITSIASMLCGLRCTPEALNAEKPENLLAEKINRHYAEFVNTLGNDVEASIYERNWLEPQRFKQHAKVDALTIRSLGDSYLNRYIEANNLEVGKGSSDSFLLAVSFFNATPWSMKNLIYRDGRWISDFMRDKSSTLLLRALRDWALFEQLPDISNVNAEKSTFKFIDSEMTHRPWMMELGKCRLQKDVKQHVRDDGLNENHMATEVCALRSLSKWFGWMREQGIYDNTRIILASDHGQPDSPEAKSRLSGVDDGVAAAFFLMKDFNADYPFKESKELTSNKNIGEIIAGRPAREDIHRRTFFKGAPKMDDFNGQLFIIDGPILDKQSWKEH